MIENLMDNEQMVWLGLGAAALLLLLLQLIHRFAWRAKPAPVDEGEKAPVPVEGTSAFAGMHKGHKYWIYFETGQARVEMELGAEIPAPFMADRRAGPAKLPGDARDPEVLELFKLRAQYVEAAFSGALAAAQFPDKILNLNSGSPLGPAPDTAQAEKVVELLAAIREKSLKPAPPSTGAAL